MGDATVLTIGYKTMRRSEQKFVWFAPPPVTFWKCISRKRGQQNLSYKFVGGQEGGLGAVSLVSVPIAQCAAPLTSAARGDRPVGPPITTPLAASSRRPHSIAFN